MNTAPSATVDWRTLAHLNQVRLKTFMAQQTVDALLACTMDNWRYITAIPVPRSIAYYSAHWVLLVPTLDEPVLFPMESRAQAVQRYAPWHIDVRPMPFHGTREALQPTGVGAWAAIAAEAIRDYGLSRGRIALDPGVPFCVKDALVAALPQASIVDAGEILRRARVIKNPEEIKAIRQACVIAEIAMERGLAMVGEGVRECEVAGLIEQIFRVNGADGPINTPFVSAGDHPFLGYLSTSDRVIRDGNLVRIDIGCAYGGYYSDFSRTVHVGPPDASVVGVYDAVRAGLAAAECTAKPGVSNTELHTAIQDALRTQTGGQYEIGWFAGHGLGVGVHEDPMIGPAGMVEEMALEPGMYFCLEPSVRVEGKGLLGLEDDLVVTASGVEIMTHTAFSLSN